MARKKTPQMPELSEDIKCFFEELQDESDRGAALIAAAYLDEVLDSMLRAHLVEDTKWPKRMKLAELLGGNRPLGTFSARVSVAYFIGLIGPKTFQHLDFVRRIRNKFAHCRGPANFEQRPIRDLCSRLPLIFSGVDHVAPGVVITTRDRFVQSTCWLAMTLVMRGLSVRHLNEAKDSFPIPLTRINVLKVGPKDGIAAKKPRCSTTSKTTKVKRAKPKAAVKKAPPRPKRKVKRKGKA